MKFRKLLLAPAALLMGLSLVACGGEKESSSTNPGKLPEESTVVPSKPTPEVKPVDKQFDYYPHSKLNADKVIYSLNDSSLDQHLNNDELFTAQAIQGLFARKEVSFYVNSGYVTNGTNTDEYYLDFEAKRLGLEVKPTTLEEAVEIYKSNWDKNIKAGIWGSKMSLTDFNVPKKPKAYDETSGGYDTPGFIVYREGTISVNVAATLSGITGFLPVEREDVAKYEAMGLKQKFNVDSIALGYKWIFDCALSEINPDGLVHQVYKSEGNVTNPYLKDYGIQNKYMYVYYDSETYAPTKFRRTLHEFLTPNRPIYGYAFREDQDVAFFSEFGQFLIPTDYTCNLSFFSAKEIDNIDKYVQKNSDRNVPAEANKHYVAFVVSDGDNATYWQNTQTFSTNYMNAIGRENDDFKVTWSITPSLADLMPSVMNNAYNNAATKNDYFCAPVSGHGYINAGGFESQADGSYFKDFCNKLDVYMGKTDQEVCTIIGGNSKQDLGNVLNGYASCENLKGGIVLDGNKYFGNVPGKVEWVNGKPFVGPRDSLWETTPAYIAARLNMYEKDIHSIDGYSIINVHPWSHSYEDIRTICGMLNDDVEVVSVDRLFKMMTDNITDKTTKTPAKNGVSITEAQLQSNPSSIPVNPLYNDFLLWEEDWTGSGVKYHSTDNAMSNVGAMYKGSIEIASGSVAKKNEFTLPNIDRLWVSLSARANSSNPNEEANMKLSITIDGVKKTVIESAGLKGVRGMNTEKITGDGWQKFAIPLEQYFDSYKGKKCVIEVEALAGASIKIDQVQIMQRGLKDAFTGDAYNNEFDNKSTDDWFLGDQYKTSQYYFWGAYDHTTLKSNGSLQIDCSDGGGNEKRNGNTNIWTGKQYVLPNSNDLTFEFALRGGGDAGAMAKISLYVDGKLIVLHDWTRHLGYTEYSVKLSELVPGLNVAGKKATIILEARDSGVNNGSGECLDLLYFRTL